MARKPRPPATRKRTLQIVCKQCPACGRGLVHRYTTERTVVTVEGLVRLRSPIHSCSNRDCPQRQRPYHPEEEGRIVLPEQEIGLDVIALVGFLRYRDHCSVPEIHRELLRRGIPICQRAVTHQLHRYDELVALQLSDHERLQAVLAGQGRAILAIDGLQPDVGHEVLWVIRECLSGEVLLARSLLSSTEKDLAALFEEVTPHLGVPVAGVVSDGQHSIRKAVTRALPGAPHQLCHFHYLREAGRPIYEADRHAKKELKKRVRGIRPLERAVEGRDDPAAQTVRGYCSAVRSALTDDGRPPLRASGLRLRERLGAVRDSLAKVLIRPPDPAEPEATKTATRPAIKKAAKKGAKRRASTANFRS